jgi:hypothetical protein
MRENHMYCNVVDNKGHRRTIESPSAEEHEEEGRRKGGRSESGDGRWSLMMMMGSEVEVNHRRDNRTERQTRQGTEKHGPGVRLVGTMRREAQNVAVRAAS